MVRNWFLIFWFYLESFRKTIERTFSCFCLLRKAFYFFHFHGCTIVNCKQARLQFPQQQIASLCVIETRTSKLILLVCLKEKRSTISLSRGYFSCWLLSITLYAYLSEWVFARSNSVNLLKWEFISILLNIFNKKNEMTKVNISVKIWNCDLKNVRCSYVLQQHWIDTNVWRRKMCACVCMLKRSNSWSRSPSIQYSLYQCDCHRVDSRSFELMCQFAVIHKTFYMVAC